MIAIVTDSTAQLPAAMARRLGVEVVPITVTIDGREFREGVDLDAQRFWSDFAADGVPPITTSQPSPGAFAAVYRRLVDDGAEQIVSVHVGEEHSGTLNAARLAAGTVDVPVHLVDSRTASFGVGCCAWEAATAVAEGAAVDEVVARAEATAASVGTAFIIQALDFARRGGRLAPHLPEGHDGVMVLGGVGGAIDLLATAHSLDDLCDAMVEPFLATGRPIRAGVSLADPATIGFTEGIEARLRAADVPVEMIRYRVGPSVAAHTGPGSAGGFWYPVGDRPRRG